VRSRPRGEIEFGAAVFVVAVVALLGLAMYGGRSLWLERSKPDDKCYWLSDDRPPFKPCLLDAPPPSGCVKMQFIEKHQVMCAEPERLADFTQKTGRRLCGQVSKTCQGAVQ
jgi:hypothetical protein